MNIFENCPVCEGNLYFYTDDVSIYSPIRTSELSCCNTKCDGFKIESEFDTKTGICKDTFTYTKYIFDDRVVIIIDGTSIEFNCLNCKSEDYKSVKLNTVVKPPENEEQLILLIYKMNPIYYLE